jgi:hypothetical protein
MTREEYSRTLCYMERLRMDSYEAESMREERAMVREYGLLAKQIEPYALGTKEFDATPVSPS